MILILTSVDDVHADVMERELTGRDAPYRRLDPAEAVGAGGTSAYFGPGGPRRWLGNPMGPVDLEGVHAVWWRRPRPFPVPESLAGTQAGQLAREEIVLTMMDLLDSLDTPGVRIVPAPYRVTDRAQGKQRQLRIAAELGFELPPTLVTDDPDALLDFAGRHGRLVTKRAAPGLPFTAADGAPLLRYTEVLRPVDLLNVDALALCPVVVQAYVPKRVELRVTVAGDRVLAAEIDSQGTNHTRHDWRRYDRRNTAMTVHELPGGVAAQCLALTRVLGLRYGAIDLVLTPDGRYVFLEINPSGQYHWVEDATGLPITSAIADVLTGVDSFRPVEVPIPIDGTASAGVPNSAGQGTRA